MSRIPPKPGNHNQILHLMREHAGTCDRRSSQDRKRVMKGLSTETSCPDCHEWPRWRHILMALIPDWFWRAASNSNAAGKERSACFRSYRAFSISAEHTFVAPCRNCGNKNEQRSFPSGDSAAQLWSINISASGRHSKRHLTLYAPSSTTTGVARPDPLALRIADEWTPAATDQGLPGFRL